MGRMIRRLYDWTLSLAAHPHALWALALVSFIESSVFPIPPDILMIPMIIAAPRRAFLIAGVCTLASVAGALLGYWIGSAAFEQIGRPVLEFYGKDDRFDEFAGAYNAWGAWAVLVAGITPFPFKVITILSGATGLSIPIFIVSSLIARATRFFIVAALLWKFGPPIRDFIERRLGLVFSVFMVLLLGGFFALRYL
ncbi:membrane protein YqaA, SNARE-associated domain [Palleronia salina]|uniref:Membrane protein YqaA, SNARE-associated domain n=2 Tax=Palleronia salina TaxID=313368 RepID=A0A1M6B241_9RHOB|nr:membrane protein YqaA, SNARE-associated domain [Palleronia salina]